MIFNFKRHAHKVVNNKLAHDSIWAIFGNGLGNALMLLAGIVIARLLGKDLYGEYGIIKTTMFYIASFTTLGLGTTTTKYIADYINSNKKYTKCIVRDSLRITLSFSSIIAITLILFSNNLADYLNEPKLSSAFRALAIIIVFKAFTTTQIGILAGFKEFRHIAINSLISGCFMLAICIPTTYLYGLTGSLAALLSSQILNAVINHISIQKTNSIHEFEKEKNFTKELLCFTFPVALQESSYTICHWSAILLLTKLSNVGELGLYTAADQWNIIIQMIPSLMSSVVLSYLSSTINDENRHYKTVTLMLTVNLTCSIIPFLIVYCFAKEISFLYGESFSEMKNLLRIITFATIFEAGANVFKSEFLAIGKTWALFLIRLMKDLILVSGTFLVLTYTHGISGARCFGYVNIIDSCFFFVVCWITYLFFKKKKTNIKVC